MEKHFSDMSLWIRIELLFPGMSSRKSDLSSFSGFLELYNWVLSVNTWWSLRVLVDFSHFFGGSEEFLEISDWISLANFVFWDFRSSISFFKS